MLRNWVVVGLSAIGMILGVFSTLLGLGMIGIAVMFNESEPKIVKRINKLLAVIVTDGKPIPKVLSFRKRDYGIDIILNVPEGFCTDDLEKHKKQIEQNLNCETQTNFDNGIIKLKLIQNKFKENYPFEIVKAAKENLMFLCHSRTSKEFVDLSVYPMILTGGTTRSGKTGSWKSILANAILTKPWEFYIADFKENDFAKFKNCAKVVEFITEPKQFENTIDSLLNEMEYRKNLFTEKGVVNIIEYHKFVDKRLRRKILFADEFGDVAEDDKVMEKLNKLMRKGGSFGLNVFLATQKPTNDSCPTKLKANMDCRICFRVTDQQNMRTVLDTSDLEKINIQGRAYLKTDTIKEVQFMYADDIEPILKDTYIDKTKKELKQQTGVVKHDFDRAG